MGLVGDMVVQTANAPGTGTFSLIAAPAGRSSFMAQTGAGQVFYFAEDGTSWEKGIGTVTGGSPDTLSRDTVLGNSLSTTAKINFSDALTIVCDVPAERSLWSNAAGDALLVSNRKLSGLAPAVDIADAPRTDQVEWMRIGGDTVVTGTSGASFILPSSGFSRFRVTWSTVLPAGATGLVAQFSVNGGSSWDSASHYYNSFRDYLAGVDYNNVTTQILLNGNRGGSRSDFGTLEFANGGGGGRMENVFNGAAGLAPISGGFAFSGGVATNVLIAVASGTFSVGVIGLSGRRS